jgi:DNA-directed RNA polymerase subunit P
MSTYICLVCGAEVDVDLEGKNIQCTKCGNRIVMKPRPPALKKRVPAI